MTQQKATPSLEERLSRARATASEAESTLHGIKTRMTIAVQEQRYGDAEALKSELPDAEHAWVVATAEQRALETVIAELDRQRAEHLAALAAERRKQQATAHLNAAADQERELMDELARVRAELVAGLDACGMSIQRGYQLESAVRQARSDQARARVDAGEMESMPGHIAGPNPISAMVESSATLLAIKNGQALLI